ncbi:quinone oxidoreductase family protein [Micromonospora arborensis]|uniref:quinone oxidoreductase family protein n=1 Tax=Micromonospora arborensis TaxID=2116518 RepID=UPI003716E3A3
MEVPVRRIRYYEYGSPAVLRLEEATTPEPGPGELLVRTEAIGVTLPSVRKVRGEGDRAPLPGVLGGEIAGEVIAIGPGVSSFAVGDRVTSLTFTGSYADLVLAPDFMASRIPDGASCTQAVALVRSSHVALAALATARPTATESVLITGAASGVGHLAVQLAKIHGIERVVAAVSSPDKADFLRGLGADEVVTYDSQHWGEPVDVVLDGVGGDLLPRALAALRPGGRLIFFSSGGGTVPAFDLLAGSKTVTGLAMARFANTEPKLYEQHHQQLWQLSQSRQLRPVVHAEIPLTEAASAHEIIEARANLGKVVLRP